MASSATTIFRLEKMAAGENDGTWGGKANTVFDMIESAIGGTTAVSTTGGTTTLTNVDFTDDQAKKHVLSVTGTLVSNATIVIPNTSRVYTVINATSGAFTLAVKTSSGSGKTVTQAATAKLYCDGSDNITYAAPQVVTTTGGPATASGAAASAISVSPTGNLTSTNAQAAFAELQGDIDSINTSLDSKQPLDADLTTIAGLSVTKGNVIVGNGSAWTALSVGTNGTVLRVASAQSSGTQWAGGAPSSTTGLFAQTAAPTGWTKLTNLDDYALRVVSGTASTGGSSAFTTAFASARTVAGATNNHTLLESQIPGHTHNYTTKGAFASLDSGGFTTTAWIGDATAATSATGGGGTHNHAFSTTVDMAVRYIDVIRATCDA